MTKQSSADTRTKCVLVPVNGKQLIAGHVVHYRDGWRFLPRLQCKPSRKGWPTPDAALAGRVKNYTLALSSDVAPLPVECSTPTLAAVWDALIDRHNKESSGGNSNG
jgi:hypothetical protein